MIYYFAYNTYNFVLGTSAEREQAQWEQPQFREQAQFRNKCRKGTSNEKGQAKGTSAGVQAQGTSAVGTSAEKEQAQKRNKQRKGTTAGNKRRKGTSAEKEQAQKRNKPCGTIFIHLHNTIF